MKIRLVRTSFVLLVAFIILLASSQFVPAEDVELQNSSGFLGIYHDGAKIGFASWTLERKERKKKVYYRIIFNETHTGKNKVSTYSYNGTVNKDMTVKSLSCDIKKGSRTTNIKARESGGTVSVTTTSGGKKMPPLKVKTKKDTTWSYCAALVWAWRNLPADKPAVFSRLLAQGGRVASCSLKPNSKLIGFQDNKIEGVEWTDEEGRELVQTDANGNLLRHISTSKRGSKTEYISEPEKVAKSPNTYETFEGELEEGENGKEQLETRDVIGDTRDIFKGCLKPVKSRADESSEGEYLKVDALFSIKAISGWECFSGFDPDEDDEEIEEIEQEDEDEEEEEIEEEEFEDGSKVWRMLSKKDKHHRILICATEIGDNGEVIDHESEDAGKQASNVFDSLLMILIIQLGDKLEFNRFSMVGGFPCKQYKFPDGAYLYEFVMFASNSNKEDSACKIYGLMSQNDEYNVFAFAVIPEDDWDDIEDDIYKMLGSFRVLE